MLDTLHSIFWVHSLIDLCLNQTMCVSYFTEFLWGSFGIVSLFWVHLVIGH